MANYEALRSLDIEYTAELTPEEAASVLNEMTRVEVISRFLSLRLLATVLTDEEYATFRQFLADAGAQSPRVADMAEMLASACSDDGATGGIDFGEPSVRQFVAIFGAIPGMQAAADRVLALATREVLLISDAGLETVSPAQIRRVRSME